MSKTITNVTAELAAKRPHAYSNDDVAGWIKDVDASVTQYLNVDGAPIIPADNETALFIPAPFDNIYFLYCLAQMDFLNRDYDQYANTYAMYNARLDEYLKYKARTPAAGSASGGISGSIGGTSISAGDNHIIV